MMNPAFLIFLVFCISQLQAQIQGCTDPLANNFNSSATQNDGSCRYNHTISTAVRSWNLPSTINESSGLITWNEKIWTHNDDTDINLYELNIDSINNFTAFELKGTKNIDWEEIAQDDTHIYVGDFGNNANGNRKNLYILRIEKASLLSGNLQIDSILFSYSEQIDFSPSGPNNTNFDCEAMVVSKDSIYLFTKEWVSQKTTIYALPKQPGSHFAHIRSSWNIEGLITGAAYIEEKRLIVLSGYSNVLQPFVYLLYGFKNHDFFGGNKRKITLNHPFHQVEGITTEDGLIYYVSNERLNVSPLIINQKLMRFNFTPFLRNYLESLCDLPKPVITAEGNILTSSYGEGNQWYNESGLIFGATNQTLVVEEDGTYFVVISNEGCPPDTSEKIQVILTSIQGSEIKKIFLLYPNPVSHKMIVEAVNFYDSLRYEIINISGQFLHRGVFTEKTEINTSDLVPGTYLIRFENGQSLRFVKAQVD